MTETERMVQRWHWAWVWTQIFGEAHPEDLAGLEEHEGYYDFDPAVTSGLPVEV